MHKERIDGLQLETAEDFVSGRDGIWLIFLMNGNMAIFWKTYNVNVTIENKKEGK